jgi:hypothetical protein
MHEPPKIKPICYLNANATDVLKTLAEQGQPEETLALLKLLTLGNQQLHAGKVTRVSEVVARLRAKRAP